MKDSADILLSIVVPNFNNASFLPRCINSILEYKGTDIEVVFVDDGSTDDSVEVVSNITKSDERVKILQQENMGVSVARNYGIENATGRYITFVDSDDNYENDAVSLLINRLKDNPLNDEMLIFGISKVHCENDNVVEKTQWGARYYAALKSDPTILKYMVGLYMHGVYNSPCNKIYIRSVILDNNIKFPVGIKTGEDCIFNIEYALQCSAVSILDRDLYCYYVNRSDFSSAKLTDVIALLDGIAHKSRLRYELFEKVKVKFNFSEKECEQLLLHELNHWRAAMCLFLKRAIYEGQLKRFRAHVKANKQLCFLYKISVFKAVNFKEFVKAIILKIAMI